MGGPETLLKVDVLKRVGTGYAVLKPTGTTGGSDRYKVTLGGEMACEVDILKVGHAPMQSTVQGKDEAEETEADAIGGKAYLEKSGVLPFIQAMLQVVMKEKPKDPFGYMTQMVCKG